MIDNSYQQFKYITGIPIGLKLPGSVVKPRPLKSQQVIAGNKTHVTGRQMCPSDHARYEMMKRLDNMLLVSRRLFHLSV